MDVQMTEQTLIRARW